jgi:hypothetical protein
MEVLLDIGSDLQEEQNLDKDHHYLQQQQPLSLADMIVE